MIASREQVEQYERDGVMFPMSVLTPKEVSQFRSAYERLETRLGGRLQHRHLIQPHLC
jgi:hypothetical protein